MASTVIALKPAHYHSIDDDIIDVHGRTIGPIGYAVYGYLCRRRNRKTGQCTPSISRIAQAFDIARSTVKIHLRKLEEAGLIEIHERQDAAGDPTSHLYILLDPSPAAVAKRLADRKAAAAYEQGRPPADPPPPPGVGCLPTYPGPSADLPGRPSADPEPEVLPRTTEMNQENVTRAEEKTQEPPLANPCPHPEEERSYFGNIAVCQHCWELLEDTEGVTERASERDEAQAHAASAA
jgi:DNA-binding transcriptional ArsR family regulator